MKLAQQMAKVAKNVAPKVSSSPPVKLSINGRGIVVPAGSTILQAIRASGARVPTLCYHPSSKPSATCRMCLVQVDKRNKPVPSCHTPVEDGMIIQTDTQQLKDFRTRDLQFLLSRHPNDCMRCEASGSCKLQDLVAEYQVEEYWPKRERGSPQHPEHTLHDHTSPAIYRDMDKCIECGLCVDACADQQIHAIGFAERSGDRIPVTVFDKPLSETNCISCGQCTWRCPVGALVERPDWHRVLDVLDSKRRFTVVQTAPATRVAIGEEFGFDPGTVLTGRLVNALRAVGFDFVTDTNFSADLTIMEEANELLARLKGERSGNLPLFTSCCPGWINYVEIHRPDLIPHLSTTKSPQQMHGAMTKYGPFAQNVEADQEPFVVSIMPCTAKKDEAVRPSVRGDIDAVLTTRELAKLLRHRGVNFAALPEDGEFDSPLGESSGAAAIFGASGGVLEAALRTAANALGIDAPVNWESVRGVDERVKVATVPGLGSVAAVNSIGAAIDFLNGDAWKDHLMIEVMTCRGGCLGGGGEPKSDDPDILQKRMKGIYEIDAKATIRKSHLNTQVQELYNSFLDHPLSEKAEHFLHATYAERRSPRDKLMRFLAAVDTRDGTVASGLFAEDGVWRTNTEVFGDIRGRDPIQKFINSRLPSLRVLKPGEERPRHVMLDHAKGTDVLAPTGEKVHFDIHLNDRGLITELARIPI